MSTLRRTAPRSKVLSFDVGGPDDGDVPEIGTILTKLRVAQ
jgi:hypothetical protein